MLVQIRDALYLETQRNVHPNVTRDMYSYAGDTFTIPDDSIRENETYSYKGFHWLGKWLIPQGTPTPPSAFHLPTTNWKDKYAVFINKTQMPERLQYIRLVSRNFGFVGRPDLQLNGYKIILDEPESGVRFTDPSMYIKFEGASEYNVTKYLIYNSIGRTILRQEDRQYEDLVVEVFKNLASATKEYLDTIKKDNVVFNERGIKQFGILHYQANFEYIDYSYLPYFIQDALTHYTTHLDLQYSVLLDDNIDKSLIYMYYQDKFYAFTQAEYTTYLYNHAVKHCPVFDIQYIGQDPVSVYVRQAYGIRGEVLVPNWNYMKETDFLNSLFERLADSDHKWSSIERGMLFRGSVYTMAEYENILASFEKYKVYGLTMDNNSFTYDGQRYYLGDDDIINDYDYEPYIEFYGDRDDLHLGIELEIDGAGESHDNALMVMAPLWREAYCMHDGSLNEGFEIATMPMTLDYAESIKDRFVDSMGIARLLGYNSHNTNTCGLHIHFDRSFFGRDYRTQNTKASYLAIIMERNWEKFVQFSRRNYSRLDNWAKKMDLVQDIYADDDDDDAQSKFSRKYGNGEKYIALNTSHSNTYELRIFRGTLKTETLFATMQFVDNLVRVAKDCTSLAKAQQITFADIIDYNHHKELIEYVNTRGILTREYKEYEGA